VITESKNESLEPLVDFIQGRRIVVVTGAGCSTESGIPDYGGLDSRRRSSRIQFGEFVRDPIARSRYWSRSMIGWPAVANARPNAGHLALAELARVRLVTGIITQNVDGLHQRAGSRRVLELHGTLFVVRCLECGATESRADVQQRLYVMNPELGHDGGEALEPDGDAEVRTAFPGFRVPSCLICDGVLKPDVVFFGENVPKDRVASAWCMYENADTLLVVGSSLAVFSGFRFVQRASQEGRPIAIVNIGPTRGDALATLKVAERTGIVLGSVTKTLGHKRFSLA